MHNKGVTQESGVAEISADNISLDNVGKSFGVINSNFKAEGGTISMKDSNVTISEGKSMLAAIIELESGSLTNAGTIEGELQMSGGTFTMVDGTVAGALTATSGTINISGEVTFTGEVNLGSDVVQFSATGEGAPLTRTRHSYAEPAGACRLGCPPPPQVRNPLLMMQKNPGVGTPGFFF